MQYANELNFDLAYSRMYSRSMTIGYRLDKAMTDAKISSQSQLARTSGVPQPTINRILKGNGKKGPETDTIRKLAAACNVTFEWLNEGIGDPDRGTHPQLSLVNKAPQPDGSEEILAEIIEFISAYKIIGKKERALILKSAKLAAKRASEGGIDSTGD